MKLLINNYGKESKVTKGVKKVVSIVLLTFIMVFTAFCGTTLALDDSKNLGFKNISDPKYVWRVDFTSPGDFESIKNSIGIRELNGDSLGKLVNNIKVEPDNDQKTVKIIPPEGGYELGKTYRITVGKGAKSRNNQNIKRDVLLDFKVGKISDLNVDVIVSPYLPILKKVTIDYKDSYVKKFKIEGNENLFDIDKEAVTLIGGDTAKIYFYDNNLTLLREGTIDISKSNRSTISLD